MRSMPLRCSCRTAARQAAGARQAAARQAAEDEATNVRAAAVPLRAPRDRSPPSQSPSPVRAPPPRQASPPGVDRLVRALELLEQRELQQVERVAAETLGPAGAFAQHLQHAEELPDAERGECSIPFCVFLENAGCKLGTGRASHDSSHDGRFTPGDCGRPTPACASTFPHARSFIYDAHV